MPQRELEVGVNPMGNPKIQSTMPRRSTRDDLHVQVSRRSDILVRTDAKLPRIVPSALSVATGGAVIGGVFFGMPGAVVGGVAGALLGATAHRRNGAS